MSERISIRGELDTLLAKNPFESFTIVMASGDRYLIQDASDLVVGQDVMNVIPRRPGGHYLLRSNQISSIEISAPR